MNSLGEIWRQRLWVWLPALLFFGLNVGAFAVYQTAYADRVQTLDVDLADRRQQLETLAADRRKEDGLLTQIQTNKRQVAELYSLFSTRSQRMVAATGEVKALARRAGLDPLAISYPEEPIESYGLVKRSFSFTVDGTYVELRRFISLLEQSKSFLTLEQVNLTEGGAEESPELRMNLTLSTLFAREPGDGTLDAARRSGRGL